MKIRKEYVVFDQLKLLLILLALLLFAIALFMYTLNNNTSQKISTMEKLLQTALEPVGTTMYIWGGGWNDSDNASGNTSTQLGLRPEWNVFASEQAVDYDFKKYRFEREKGLDCSGYVGWVLYNTFERKDGQPGYVTTSTKFAECLEERGWGRLISNPKTFLPGDIVSMEGHVWICLGTCEDESVLLVHSSPPGVSVCGTAVRAGTLRNIDSERQDGSKEDNKEKSIAIMLAEEYMRICHPSWQEKYPNRRVEESYLKNVQVFRWNENVMSDAKEIQKLGAEDVMERIVGLDEFP